MQNAGQSLAGAAGNLVAKDIGQRLGVSELGVENSEAVGGSAFTIGQYLSPRLFISYGMGIFQTGQVVTLRYKINNKVSLDAIQGTLDRRAGLSYRIEK